MYIKPLQKLKVYFEPTNLIDNSQISPTNRRILQFVLYILLFFTVLNYFSNGFFRHILSNSYDYHETYDAGKKIIQGKSNHIYDDFWNWAQPGKNAVVYIYPVLPAVIFSPLSLFNYNTAKILLKVLTQIFVIISFLLLLKSSGNLKRIEKLICFFLFFNFFPCFLSLYLGQPEFFLLTFLLLSFYYFQEGKDLLSAFFLSLVIYFKIFPIFFLLYFLWKKEYKYCLILFVMLVLMGGISLLFVDFDIQKQYFLKILSFRELDSFPDNQSITGFFSRILTTTWFTHGWISNKLIKDICIYLISAIIIFFTGKATGKRLNRTDERYKYEFSILIIIMLLLSRYTNTHHFVFLIIPFSYLFIYYFRKEKFHLRNVMFLVFCYAFFATYVPPVATKFIDTKVLLLFVRGLPILFLSFPFYTLVILWLLNFNMLLKYET